MKGNKFFWNVKINQISMLSLAKKVMAIYITLGEDGVRQPYKLVSKNEL